MSRSTLILVLASLLALPILALGAPGGGPPPPNTTTGVSFPVGQNPIGQYCSTMVTSTTTSNLGTVSAGKSQIHARGTACAAPPANPFGSMLDQGSVIGGQFSTPVTATTGPDYTTSPAGNTSWLSPLDLQGNPIGFGYRAKYLAEGAQINGTNLDNSDSPCLPLVVQAPGCSTVCPASGLTIVATEADGPGCPAPGTSTSWTYQIAVTNCSTVPISNVTAQGGSNGWTTNSPSMSADTGSAGVRKTNLKNSTILWNITAYGPMGPGQIAILNVTLSGSVKNGTADGTILYLNGPWSAINGDLGLKTDYADRVTLSVQSTGTCPTQ